MEPKSSGCGNPVPITRRCSRICRRSIGASTNCSAKKNGGDRFHEPDPTFTLIDTRYSITLNADGEVATKAAAPVNSGYASGSPYLDTYNKTKGPSAWDLIRECLSTAYACASLNANLIASTPLRLYVKTTRRKQKSWLMERGDTKALKGAEMKRLRRLPIVGKMVSDATDVREVVSHPLLDLLAKPTSPVQEDGVGMSEYTLMETTQRYQEIVGRGYWYCPRDGIGKTPSAIWMLPAHLMQEMPDLSGKRVIDYYWYTGPGANAGQRYEVDEIVPFRFVDLNTGGYYGGFSPLRAAFEQVKLFRQYAALANAQLRNGGKPSAIWSPSGDGMIGTDEAKRMRLAFRQTFAMSEAGGIMIQEQPGELHPLSWKAEELVSPEQYALAKNVVANCFDVPTTKLDRNDSNLASAKTGDYAHARDAGLPRLRRNESALNCFFVPMYDPDGQLFLAYDDPEGLRDEAMEMERSKGAMSLGALTRNELRDEAGYDAQPWGNMPLVANTMVAVDLATGIPGAPKAPIKPDGTATAIGPDGKPIADDAANAGATTETDIQPAAVLALQTAYYAHEIPRDAAIANAVLSLGCSESQASALFPKKEPDAPGGTAEIAPKVEPQKKSSHRVGNRDAMTGLAGPLPQGEHLASVIGLFFVRQSGAALSALDDWSTKAAGDNPRFSFHGDGDIPGGFTALSGWTNELAHECMPIIELTTQAGAKGFESKVGADPELMRVVNPHVIEAAKKATFKLCDETNATTSKQLDDALAQLRTELAEGLELGDTRTELRKRVQSVFETAEKSRAETIARTEVSRATHTGEAIAAKQSNVVKAKHWIASADCCDVCQGYADEGDVPLDHLYDDDAEWPVEFAPGHPRCQCSMGYSIKDKNEIEADIGPMAPAAAQI